MRACAGYMVKTQLFFSRRGAEPQRKNKKRYAQKKRKFNHGGHGDHRVSAPIIFSVFSVNSVVQMFLNINSKRILNTGLFLREASISFFTSFAVFFLIGFSEIRRAECQNLCVPAPQRGIFFFAQRRRTVEKKEGALRAKNKNLTTEDTEITE